MYEQYSVAAGSNFQNLSIFDDYINSGKSDSAAFKEYMSKDLNCSLYDSKKNPIVNMESVLCGYIIQRSTERGCNPKKPLPLCKSIAEQTVQSFEKWKSECNALKTPSYISDFAANLPSNDPSSCVLNPLEAPKETETTNGSESNQAEEVSEEGEKSTIEKLGGLYFIIGISVGSVVLLIIIISTILCMKKRKKKDQPFIEHEDDDAEIMNVIYEYVPTLFDEIHLSVGDKVLVKIKFDDGWAYGMNMKTKKEGSFPLACVDEPGRGSSDRENNRLSVDHSYNVRASSLYGFPK
jgi:hypothetical protein